MVTGQQPVGDCIKKPGSPNRGARPVLQRCCLACGSRRANSRDSLASTSHNACSVAEDRAAEGSSSGLNRSLGGFRARLGGNFRGGFLNDHSLATAVAVGAASRAAAVASDAALALDHNLTAALVGTGALVATVTEEAVAALTTVATVVTNTMATAMTTTVATATAVVAAAIRHAAAAVTGNSSRLTAHEGDGHQAQKKGRSDSIEALHSQSPKRM